MVSTNLTNLHKRPFTYNIHRIFFHEEILIREICENMKYSRAHNPTVQYFRPEIKPGRKIIITEKEKVLSLWLKISLLFFFGRTMPIVGRYYITDRWAGGGA